MATTCPCHSEPTQQPLTHRDGNSQRQTFSISSPLMLSWHGNFSVLSQELRRRQGACPGGLPAGLGCDRWSAATSSACGTCPNHQGRVSLSWVVGNVRLRHVEGPNRGCRNAHCGVGDVRGLPAAGRGCIPLFMASRTCSPKGPTIDPPARVQQHKVGEAA